MRGLYLTLLSAVVVCFEVALAPPCYADGLFRADMGYVLDDSSTGGTDTKKTRQLIDLTAGYLGGESGWALFGQYAMEKVDQTGSPEGNRTSYGPGLGWISRGAVGPYITGTYYLSSQYVIGGTTDSGSGYQVDVGIKVDLSKVFLVAGMSYEHFEYSKNSSGALSPPDKQSQVDPRIGLQIEF